MTPLSHLRWDGVWESMVIGCQRGSKRTQVRTIPASARQCLRSAFTGNMASYQGDQWVTCVEGFLQSSSRSPDCSGRSEIWGREKPGWAQSQHTYRVYGAVTSPVEMSDSRGSTGVYRPALLQELQYWRIYRPALLQGLQYSDRHVLSPAYRCLCVSYMCLCVYVHIFSVFSACPSDTQLIHNQ